MKNTILGVEKRLRLKKKVLETQKLLGGDFYANLDKISFSRILNMMTPEFFSGSLIIRDFSVGQFLFLQTDFGLNNER